MIQVRQAQMTEYDDIVKFYCDLIDSMSNSEFVPEWKMGVYPTEQFLIDSISKQELFLAYFENSLVGVMILNHDSAPEYTNVKWHIDAQKDEVIVIHALGVSVSYQGKGIAKQMVSCAIDICKKSAIKAIRLDVLKKNIPAAKLYMSMGFQYITAVKIFYEDTGLTDFDLYELVLGGKDT